jgi:hypothetical protein
MEWARPQAQANYNIEIECDGPKRFRGLRLSLNSREIESMEKPRLKAGRAARVLLAFSTMMAATIASAGPKNTVALDISPLPNGATVFSGSLGATRNSTSNAERISCSVTRHQGTSSTFTVVTCNARDKDSNSVSCTSSSEAFAEAVSGLRNDGLLEIAFNADGTCTAVEIDESSDLVRKN